MIQAPVRYYRRLRGRQALARAAAHRAVGHAREAAAAFDLAAVLDPGDLTLRREALEGASEAYLALGQMEAAAERAEQLVVLSPEDPDALLRAARLRDVLGRSDAAQAWRRRLDLAPGCGEAPARLAELLTGAAATPHLRTLAERAPDDAAAWRRLALALESDPASAVEAWARVLEIAGEDLRARRQLGELLVTLGRPAEALPHLRVAAEARPEDAKAWKALAKACSSLGDSAAAVEAWLRTAEAEPANRAFSGAAGRLLGEAGDSEATAAGWRRLLAADGTNAQAHHALAAHHRRRGEFAAAAPHLRIIAETAGGVKAFAQLAMALEHLGEDVEAEAAWSQALALDSGRVDLLERVVALRRRRGDLAGVVTALQSAAQVNPDDRDLHRRLARMLVEAGEPAAALDVWLRLIDLAPDDHDARLQAGLQLYDVGRRAAAAPYLAAAAAAQPDDAALWRRLAWCRRGEESRDGEIDALRQVLQVAPGDDEARTRLIEVLVEAHRRAETEPLIADLMQRRPTDVRLPALLARARRDLGDEAGALDAWRQVLTLNPAEPDANQNVGQALLAQGDLAGAAHHLALAAPAAVKIVSAWRRVARLRRETGDRDGEIFALQQLFAHLETIDLESHARLVALLEDAGRLGEGEASLVALTEADPTDATFQRLLAQAYKALNDRTSEVAAWRRLLTLVPGDIEARLRLTRRHFLDGEVEAAAALLRDLGPQGSAGLWVLAARAYDAVRDIDAEIDAWRQVLTLAGPGESGEIAAAHARLADLLTAIGETPGAAAHLAFCVDQAPDDHRLRERLAGALYAAGRKAEAAEQFAKVAEARPNQPRPWIRYARALQESGQKAAATRAWKRVLALAPDEPEATAALTPPPRKARP